MTTLNTGLLRAVLAHIDAHPELHDQRAFDTRTECGTAHCVAGWACLLSGQYTYDARWQVFRDGRKESVDPGATARTLLGITEQQAWAQGENHIGLFDGDASRSQLQEIAEELATEAGVEL
jgi:hypothetical protein